MHSWITWSSAFFTQAFSGTSPSCVACWRMVSPVARLTWGDERRDGDREGVADDARQPLVVLVLQRRLAGLDQPGAEASGLVALGMIGSRGLSDHGTPFSAKIASSASMKAGFTSSQP
jgi:hypothetical protein